MCNFFFLQSLSTTTKVDTHMQVCMVQTQYLDPVNNFTQYQLIQHELYARKHADVPYSLAALEKSNCFVANTIVMKQLLQSSKQDVTVRVQHMCKCCLTALKQIAFSHSILILSTYTTSQMYKITKEHNFLNLY